ncbi:flagellar motor switch protein FliG [bacterium]|nr:flagellar motor switch protein FliG [bacterium]
MALTGGQKAALFMIALGEEIAASVYPHLVDSEIEDLTMQIANIGKVESDAFDEVFEDFYQTVIAEKYITEGGVDYARELLEKSLGADRADEVVHKLSTFLQVTPFDFIRRTDSSNLANFLRNEHPQTIALVLAYLRPAQSSMVISQLTPKIQTDVTRRIALMDRTSPEVIREVEHVLEKNLSSVMSQEMTQAGGVESVVQILSNVDRSTEKSILENIEKEDADLAAEIKNKMFVFEDIVTLDDRSIQQVLREIDTKELSLALKGVAEEVQSKILGNLSKRAAEMLKEDMEFMGPVRLKDVEAGQQRIVKVIRSLEDAGEIIIARGETEMIT